MYLRLVGSVEWCNCVVAFNEIGECCDELCCPSAAALLSIHVLKSDNTSREVRVQITTPSEEAT